MVVWILSDKEDHLPNKASLRKRSKAFLIDAFVTGIIPSFTVWILTTMNPSLIEYPLNSLGYSVWLFLMIIRDSVKSLSLGKRFAYIKIVEIGRVDIPSFWKSFLRNIPLIVFPIDMLVTLLAGRSIGDHMMKTDIIDTRAEEKYLLRRK